jgi:PTS system nitrogen regulatory IIA component
MNALAPLLHDEDIVLDADVANRDELFAVVARLLAVRHGLNERDVLSALLAREQLGSTAMGGGIAIPHARMPRIREPACAFIRTRKPIAFDAPDHKPVSEFLVLLVPNEANEVHLKLLASAAGALSDSSFRGDLSRCARCDEVRERFANWEAP